MQQKGEVAVLLGRSGIVAVKTPVQVVGRVQAVHPGFVTERRIGHGVVEGFELAAVGIGKLRRRQGVALPDLGVGVAVQPHVHHGQGTGGVIVFLAINCNAMWGFVGGLEQQRARAAGRVIDRLSLALGFLNADDSGHDPRHF